MTQERRHSLRPCPKQTVVHYELATSSRGHRHPDTRFTHAQRNIFHYPSRNRAQNTSSEQTRTAQKLFLATTTDQTSRVKPPERYPNSTTFATTSLHRRNSLGWEKFRPRANEGRAPPLPASSDSLATILPCINQSTQLLEASSLPSIQTTHGAERCGPAASCPAAMQSIERSRAIEYPH